MSNVVRVVAALVFVALLGVVLTIPLRSSGQKSGGQPPRRSGLPTPASSPSPTKRELAEFPRSKRFLARYPRNCLRPVEQASGDGLVAAADRGRVAIATVAGDEVASFRSRPPVALSPSGRFIAAGTQGLLWTPNGRIVLFANGEFQHGLVQGSGGPWGWSPISDCGLSIESDGALQVSAADPHLAAALPMVRRGLQSFAFSPDGRKLGVLTPESGPRSPASLWIADLERSRMEEVRRFRRATCCITLGGWSPDGQHLLYWAAPGNSVSADGWPLTSVSDERSMGNWGPTLTRPSVLEVCGDRLLGLTGGDRFLHGNLVAVLQRGREPQDLTPRASYDSFTCARSGALIAASRDGRLVLFDGEGNFVRNLTTIDTGNGELTELVPDWGPPGTGILFIRQIHNTRQLAFLPEGGAEPNFVANVELSGRPLAGLFDWSGTPPTGLAN